MRRRLLIADDSKTTLEQLKKVLSADATLEVDTFADGRAALEALTKHHYSLLLTDLKMPHRDGIRGWNGSLQGRPSSMTPHERGAADCKACGSPRRFRFRLRC